MQSVQLKPEEFDAHIAAGTFRLSFIGMSNAGKSFRSKVLRDAEDFLWYHVDGEIQHELGFDDMADISAWLGYPDTPTYAEREARYLELENEFTRHASMQTNGKNLVFDTTGSVVHLEPRTLRILHDNCLIVHLDVGDESLDGLVEAFLEKPKPVAWCGYFTLEAGESEEQALRRCYPRLLEDRLAQYRQLAHISIPAAAVRDTTAQETLTVLRQALR